MHGDRHFPKGCLSAVVLCVLATAHAAESLETFELTEPRTHVLLELHSDGSAAFSREYEDERGEVSVFRSRSGTWARCSNGSDRLSRIKPVLDQTNCFIVQIEGADEQGATRLGMMFMRDGDSLRQIMEDGPALVLKRSIPHAEP